MAVGESLLSHILKKSKYALVIKILPQRICLKSSSELSCMPFGVDPL